MKTYYPSYYDKFYCLKDKCKHTCCAGWEIDIDMESLDFYKTKSELLEKISLNPSPHFLLDKNERCPFLNNNNLCDIIINYGEDNLCQICKDHPRFINEYDTFDEIGIGLTCEAAAKIIIDNPLILDNKHDSLTEEEKEFIFLRQSFLSSGITEFIYLLPDLTVGQCAIKLKTLERLDKNWDKVLDKMSLDNRLLKNIDIKDIKKTDNLFHYFIFRHFYNTSVEFCLFSALFISAEEKEIYETARMYSTEIEYSDQNIEEIENFLKEKRSR